MEFCLQKQSLHPQCQLRLFYWTALHLWPLLAAGTVNDIALSSAMPTSTPAIVKQEA